MKHRACKDHVALQCRRMVGGFDVLPRHAKPGNPLHSKVLSSGLFVANAIT